MSDIIQDSLSWLQAQRVKHRSSPVLYSRGADTVEVLATVGKTKFDTFDQYGQATAYETVDFLILSGDLVLDGQAIIPATGDRITVGDVVHETTPPPGQGKCYRTSDATTLRIFTKRIE
jgi:hypothetical protein